MQIDLIHILIWLNIYISHLVLVLRLGLWSYVCESSTVGRDRLNIDFPPAYRPSKVRGHSGGHKHSLAF